MNEIFMEMFDGATSVADSVGRIQNDKAVPGVAVLDDPMRDRILEKASGAASELCQQAEDVELKEKLIGSTYDQAGEILSPSTLEIIGGPSRGEPDFSKLFRGVEIDYSKFVRDVENSLQKTSKEKGRSVEATLQDGSELKDATLEKGVGIWSRNRLYKFQDHELQEWDYAEAN